jgi:hypothetical protein
VMRTFEIPKENGLTHEGSIVAIIQAIPDKWHILRGALFAPQGMLDSGQALVSTEMVFGSSIDCMVNRVDNDYKADVFGVLFGGKNPCRVNFGKMFGHVEVMPMEQSKLTVGRFVLMGYYGRLQFYHRQVEYIGDQPSFSCSLDISAQDTTTVSIAAHNE